MPIIQELEDLDEGQGAIDRAEFIQACLRLYQTLNVADRNIILNFNRERKPVTTEQHSFAPKISNKSKQMAMQKQMGVGGGFG